MKHIVNKLLFFLADHRYGVSWSVSSVCMPCSQIPVRPRVKRVNIRDLLFVLEQERGLQRSERLYQLLHK